MNINKNILLRLKNLIKNDYFRTNTCIALSLIILGTTSGFTKKIDSKVTNYEISHTNSSNLHLNEKLDKILSDSAQMLLDNTAIKQVLNSTVELIQNSTDLKEIDSETTDEEKIQYILEKFNLTKEQFNTLVAIVLAEARWDSYEDAYAVINTIYNRTLSKKWINFVNSIVGDETGTSLYCQSTCPNQFVVYQNGNYLKFLDKDNTNEPGYRAIIDFLTTGDKMHNFLSFVADNCGKGNYTQFVEKGNCYSNELTEEDIIPVENRIFDFDLSKNVDISKKNDSINDQEKVKVLK